MRANDVEVLTQALQWQREGQRCALVTVCTTFGASPRPPGSMAVIGEAGGIVGSVSGGCVEDDLLHEARSGALWQHPEPVLLRTYGLNATERDRYQLPCGNALKLAIEPHGVADLAEQALSRIGSTRRSVVRHLAFATGQSLFATFTPQTPSFLDDANGLHTVWGPQLRLLLVGAGEVTRYLCPLARSLGYATSVCDPRVEYTQSWNDPETPLLPGMPDDAVVAFECDERTAVIVLSHDPKLDDLALLEALKTPAFHVGALGSVISQAKRRERLALFDLSAAHIARLKGPVGLDIASRSPAEIAVSIAAELIAVHRRMEQGKPLTI